MPGWRHNYEPLPPVKYPAHYHPGRENPPWPMSYTKRQGIFTSGVLIEVSEVDRWNAPPLQQVLISALNSRSEPSPNVCLGVPVTEVRKLAETLIKFANDNNLP